VKKVAVGLSGGVDSSVAAAILIQEGFEVIGVHMRRIGTHDAGCTADKDRSDALRVAKKLGIPFKVADFREEYEELVIKRFLEEFQLGRTPNPDIWCNEVMKFGLLLDYAQSELGAEAIATGHYARVDNKLQDNSEYSLLTGVDDTKDQSYFLYRLSQDQLSKSIFPLGEMYKAEVRQRAEQLNLPTAKKRDSVGICFIGDIDMREYLKNNLEINDGDVETTKGEEIGRHEGVQLYTIGQRHGFSVAQYQGQPLYVVKKDVDRNVLVVGRDVESDIDRFTVGDLHWLSEKSRLMMQGCGIKVRVRHLGTLIACTVKFSDDESSIECTLDKPDRGIAVGQHAVFYCNDKVLGGGVIIGDSS
jgi:tRNA-specific 2-thiouridylase